MRIIVTGTSGHLARALSQIARHHDLVFISRPEFDLLKPGTFRVLLAGYRPDVVLSVAAMTNVEACEAAANLAFAINAEAPGILAHACAEIDVPIVHVSTDYVYSGTSLTPYRECDETSPINVYGRSKLAGERAVAAAAKRYVVLRTTWLYSLMAGYLSQGLKDAADGREIRMIVDQLACPTSALDLARGLLQIAERLNVSDDEALHGVFHGAGRDVASRSMVVKYALQRAGFSASVTEVSSRDFFGCAARPAYSALDSSLLFERYGIEFGGWRAGIDSTLATHARQI